jgi:GTP cyclohydrolase IV
MDAHAAPRPVRAAVSRVGLTGVEAVIRLGAGPRSAQPFAARLECYVEPDPGRRPAGGPRFDEGVTDALREVLGRAAETRAERLARAVAERVRERQGARRVEVAMEARFPEHRPAPVSGIPTQEISTLHARAVASERGTRWIVGVSAQGMTTSPHAQAVLAAASGERLAAGGFSPAEVARILRHVPVATDDQIGIGTLHVGCPEDCAFEVDVVGLLQIVEGAMSSAIFELMKRSDEGAVVERAHRRPRFVDDCVRAMVAGAVERFEDAPGAAFVFAAQDGMETLHRHRVTAERGGLLGDLRGELRRGAPPARELSMRAWLDADR